MSESLRGELDAYKSAKESEVREEPVLGPEPHLANLIKSAHEVLADAEKEVVKYPVAAAAAALVLGFVIGRISR
jgi:hypothetical protein